MVREELRNNHRGAQASLRHTEGLRGRASEPVQQDPNVWMVVFEPAANDNTPVRPRGLLRRLLARLLRGLPRRGSYPL
jgi:hypothetical protein